MKASKKQKNSSIKQKNDSKPKRNRSKARGNEYEQRIAKELRDLGFTGVVTTRAESKSMDDNKIDLVDTNHIFNLNAQLKRTQATPNYFKIRSESTVDDESFILFWNKQRKAISNFVSDGELVMMDKKLFYKLIKNYYLHETC